MSWFLGGSWARRLLHLGATAFLLLLPASEAWASCKGSFDPLCTLKELIADIEKVAPNQKSVVAAGKDLKADAAKVEKRFESIGPDVSSFGEDADAVLKMFQSALETIDSDALQLSSELIQRIDHGRQMIDHRLANESAALHAFVGTTAPYAVTADSGCSASCENFRRQLVAMFGNYERSFNLSYRFALAQLKLNGVDPPSAELPPLDLSFLVEVLDRAPGFVLFPIYEGFTAVGASGSPTSGCPDGDPACLSVASLNELFEHLNGSVQAFVGAVDSGLPSGEYRTRATASAVDSKCTLIFKDDTNEQIFVNAAWISRLAGSLISSIGEGLIALGLSELDPEGGVSVALSVVVENPRSFLRTAGTLIQGLGAAVKKVGSELNRTIVDCRGDLNLELTFCLLASENPTQDTIQSCKTDILSGKAFGLNP